MSTQEIRKVRRQESRRNKISVVLRRKIGSSSVLDTKLEIESHSFDGLRPYRGYDLPPKGYPPDLVVTPRSTKHVISIVETARQFGVPIFPRGGGTGLMGGAVALTRGVVIDFAKMNRVLKVDEEDQSVVVQPGARIGDVNKLLKKKDLTLGHDPWTRDYATVGGSISTNGMGYYGLKYGSMGEQVLGLKVVLPDGTQIETPPVQYSSTGFDLRRLFIGTEGTFGLITEATVRCFPIPESEKVIGFSFPSFESGFEAVLEVQRKELSPVSMDLQGEGYDGRCELYLVFSGLSEHVKASTEKCDTLLSSKRGAKKLGDKEAASYWESRHEIADQYEESVKRDPLSSFREKKSFDFIHVGLPASKILEYKKKVAALAKRRRIAVEGYGVWIKPEQFNFNFTRDSHVPEKNLERTVDDSLKIAVKLGGSIEYCHGVGFRLGSFLPLQYGKGFDVMKKLKRQLDPQDILNRGKLGFSYSDQS